MNKGKEIFNNFQNNRDFNGSKNDEYPQTLLTLFGSLGENLFNLLEIAESKGKTLAIKKDSLYNDEFTVEDIEFVNN